MPFGGYPNFEACVRSAASKGIDDPQSYCGAIKSRAEDSAKNTIAHFFGDTLNVVRLSEGDMFRSRTTFLKKLAGESSLTKKFSAECLSHLQMAIEGLESGDRDVAGYHLERALSLLNDPAYPLPEGVRDVGYTQYTLKKLEEETPPSTFYLDDVEIFKVGVWNGDQYTLEDLQRIVRNFEILRERVKPPIKLGHTENQKLLQEDGLPAGGWVDKLKLVGSTLVASIKDVPRAIYELVKNRAYKRVSSEIYPMYKDSALKQEFGPVLRAVAFLGGDIPAVDSLADIQALYGQSDQRTRAYAIELRYFADDSDRKKDKKEPMEFIVQGVEDLRPAPRRVDIPKGKLAFSVRMKK